jgi:hypothetical protein
MRRLLVLLSVLSLAVLMPHVALAQSQPAPGAKTTGGNVTTTPGSIFVAPAGGGAGLGRVVAEDNGFPVSPSVAAWSEGTLSISANTWTQVAAASPVRKQLLIGDAVGLGCVWSFNSSPALNEGFPFSLTGQGGSWVFDNPVATNAVYIRCATSGTITFAGP